MTKTPEQIFDWLNSNGQADIVEYITQLHNKSKQEPVAWMEYIHDEEWNVWFVEPTDLPKGHSYKPLYTTPQTKPLSNQEILKLWDADCTNVWASYLIEFARAIEERHGIK